MGYIVKRFVFLFSLYFLGFLFVACAPSTGMINESKAHEGGLENAKKFDNLNGTSLPMKNLNETHSNDFFGDVPLKDPALFYYSQRTHHPLPISGLPYYCNLRDYPPSVIYSIKACRKFFKRSQSRYDGRQHYRKRNRYDDIDDGYTLYNHDADYFFNPNFNYDLKPYIPPYHLRYYYYRGAVGDPGSRYYGPRKPGYKVKYGFEVGRASFPDDDDEEDLERTK